MTAAKIIILCAIISVAVCFTIPEEQHEEQVEDLYEVVESPGASYEYLTRQVRSPDDPKRTVEVRGEDRGRGGQTASVTYTHPVGRNVDVYGKAERNYKYNDNSGHVGIRYKF